MTSRPQAFDSVVEPLRVALADADDALRAAPHRWLDRLIEQRLDRLPRPAQGDSATRWLALSLVAREDLALVKLYEGHTDALAIRAELGSTAFDNARAWAVWASESPTRRTRAEPDGEALRLHGIKGWCSGARGVSHALVTAWRADAQEPQLVAVAMDQPEIDIDGAAWKAVGMGRTASADVHFHGARGVAVGRPGDYLRRPGFWQGGAGIAACWFGGALALGAALQRALATSSREPDGFSLAALGRVDLALQSTAAILRDAARWIDAHPADDARTTALRARLSAEATAHLVIDEATRALGAGALCHDERFARTVADLPVFLRQSHAARDFAALGGQLLGADRHRGLADASWL